MPRLVRPCVGIRAATLCLLLLRTLTGHAQPSEPDPFAQPLSLSACVELAEHSEPYVMASRARLLDADAQVSTAKTLQNPVASYLAQDLGLQNGAGSPQLLHQAMLSFPLLRAIVTAQEARTAHAQRQTTQETLAEEHRQLQLAVGRAFHELRLAERLVDIEQQAASVAAALVRQNQQRELRGDASGLEVLRAQAEELDAQRGLERANQQKRLLQLGFSMLLGAKSPRPIQLRNEEHSDFSSELLPLSTLPEDQALAALAQLQRQRPDQRQAAAWRTQAEAAAQLASLRSVPFFDLQVAVGARFSNLGAGGVVAVSTPLPLLDFGSGPRQKAQAQLLQAHTQQLQTTRLVLLEVATGWHRWQSSRALLSERARPLVAARRQVLTATEKQFAAGMISLLDLITAQRDLLTAERAEAQAQHEVELAEWQLQIALGR